MQKYALVCKLLHADWQINPERGDEIIPSMSKRLPDRVREVAVADGGRSEDGIVLADVAAGSPLYVVAHMAKSDIGSVVHRPLGQHHVRR